jgi:uncharacterized membrane protein (DUF485 family)
MQDDLVKKIRSNPAFEELKSKRASFGWALTILVMIAYYGYILLVAFNKELLGQKLVPGGITSVGIPLGLGVIAFTIIITWIYVRRANAEFDELSDKIKREAGK